MAASKEALMTSISEEILKNILNYVDIDVTISNLMIDS